MGKGLYNVEQSSQLIFDSSYASIRSDFGNKTRAKLKFNYYQNPVMFLFRPKAMFQYVVHITYTNEL